MVLVYVMFNGASETYKFEGTLKEFKDRWENHNAGIGYFTGKDVEGEIIIINPSNCGTIKMREI